MYPHSHPYHRVQQKIGSWATSSLSIAKKPQNPPAIPISKPGLKRINDLKARHFPSEFVRKSEGGMSKDSKVLGSFDKYSYQETKGIREMPPDMTVEIRKE